MTLCPECGITHDAEQCSKELRFFLVNYTDSGHHSYSIRVGIYDNVLNRIAPFGVELTESIVDIWKDLQANHRDDLNPEFLGGFWWEGFKEWISSLVILS